MVCGLFRISAWAMKAALSLLLLVAGLGLSSPAWAGPAMEQPGFQSLAKPEDAINARKGEGEARVGPLPQRVVTRDGSMGNQMFIADPNSVVKVIPENKTASLILRPWLSNKSRYEQEIENLGPVGRLVAFVQCNSVVLKIAVALILALACWYFIYLAIDLHSRSSASKGYQIKAYAIFAVVAGVMTMSVFSFLYFSLGDPGFCP